jgi:hypothetical protein
VLDKQEYIPLRILNEYYHNEEGTYHFKLPGKGQLALQWSDSYYPDVDLFEYKGEVWVKAGVLGLSLEVKGEKALLILT